MEIETAPRHPAPTPWRRLALLVVLFAPVTLLVLLPTGLGLERYVMTGHPMEGSIDRGSIAFERVVPVSDLRVGDVVTYVRPGTDDDMVTHRIVSIDADGIRTRGDADAAVDPWVLRPDSPTMSKVEFTIPWIGWAYVLLFRAQGWVLSVALAAGIVVLMTRRLRHPVAAPRIPAEPDVSMSTLAGASGTRVDGRDIGTREVKP